MQALAFWKAVAVDEANLLERFRALLEDNGIEYCVVGGQAVNAYAEPLVSLDLDVAVGDADRERFLDLAEAAGLRAEHFPHSVNLSHADSDLRIQIQTDPRYGDFPRRAQRRSVLGLDLLVAGLEDVVRGKVWAAQDPSRRASKHLKDLADLARLAEAHPGVRELIPVELLERLQ
ncbi:MAG TPA: hypothetical protein VGS57_07555 [Thermoanaerobaculia bacterium]|jgi:hypothetical protein|nr:hypothetical protein [Thermoanaerobaculia bacterium]